MSAGKSNLTGEEQAPEQEPIRQRTGGNRSLRFDHDEKERERRALRVVRPHLEAIRDEMESGGARSLAVGALRRQAALRILASFFSTMSRLRREM